MPAPDTLPYLDETTHATSRYLEALTVLREADLRAPSLLPGWSRGHVVTHLARNADALVNLVGWAESGEPRPMYPSQEQRNRDIDSGADRSLTELVEDSSTAAARFEAAARRLPRDRWEVPVGRTVDAPRFPAADIAVNRWVEVEVHHADLGIGYTAADWPADFTLLVIGRVQDDRAEGPSMVLSSTDLPGLWKFGRGQGPEVTGAAADLASWLLGRGDGSRLVSSSGDVPQLTRWR